MTNHLLTQASHILLNVIHPLRKNKHSISRVTTSSGPHAYISPNYYASEFNVPTWNYSAVHCHASISYIDDEAGTWRLLNETVTIYEGADGWHLPDEQRYRNLLNGIRFFELCNPEFEAKLKFNQNKSGDDLLSVIAPLRKTNAEAARLMILSKKIVHAEILKDAGETD